MRVMKMLIKPFVRSLRMFLLGVPIGAAFRRLPPPQIYVKTIQKTSRISGLGNSSNYCYR